jgi:hypothetical protein
MDLRNSETNKILAKANAMEFLYCPPAKAGGYSIFKSPIFNRNCLKKFIHE